MLKKILDLSDAGRILSDREGLITSMLFIVVSSKIVAQIGDNLESDLIEHAGASNEIVKIDDRGQFIQYAIIIRGGYLECSRVYKELEMTSHKNSDILIIGGELVHSEKRWCWGFLNDLAGEINSYISCKKQELSAVKRKLNDYITLQI